MLNGTKWNFLFDNRDEDAIRTYITANALPLVNNNNITINDHPQQIIDDIDDDDDDPEEIINITSDDDEDDVLPQSATSALSLPQSFNQLGNVHEQIANQKNRRNARNRAINEQIGHQWWNDSAFMFPDRHLTRRGSYHDILPSTNHDDSTRADRNLIQSAPTLHNTQKADHHVYFAYPMKLQDARNNIYPHHYDGDRILTEFYTIWTSTLNQYPDGILIFKNRDVSDFFTTIDEIFGYDNLVQIELSDKELEDISQWKNIHRNLTEIFDPDEL